MLTLEMQFQDAAGKTSRISVNDAKATLTDAEVKTAMDSILTANVFTTKNGALTAIGGAKLINKTVSEFTVE